MDEVETCLVYRVYRGLGVVTVVMMKLATPALSESDRLWNFLESAHEPRVI